jgi:aminopeptidase
MNTLTSNLHDLVFTIIAHPSSAHALVVFDDQSSLARTITQGYRDVIPEATFLDFQSASPDEIRQTIDQLHPRDLVILVQSTSFRLNEFRFRLELFNRSLAVIEHVHLGRLPEYEHQTYVDSLAYDEGYYRTVGPALKARIDRAMNAIVGSSAGELVYETAFEEAKLNIGEYSGMKNIGGQFPIGEVFTEPKDFTRVNGTVGLFAFGARDFRVTSVEQPIVLTIEQGQIIKVDTAPADFQSILDEIQLTEPLWVRELGFGMNRAMTKERRLNDVGSYERMCGIHLSLGQKHTIYAKPGMPKRSSRYHVDVFVDSRSVTLDGVEIFDGRRYAI